jgi:hypothetical protein
VLYTVVCRLSRPSGEYPTLLGAVQSASVALWQVSDSTWLIQSELTPSAVRDTLAAAIEPGDLALVFPTDVAPAVWTSLAAHRYGRKFLESAMARQQRPSTPA